MHVLCVVETYSAILFYCLCYVSLMFHLYYEFFILNFCSWYLLVGICYYKDFNKNNIVKADFHMINYREKIFREVFF